jgi:hypothetical protein
MYSVAQLDDVQVIDEPLYGHFLRASGAQHPGRDVVLAAMDCDGQAVMSRLIRQQERQGRPRLFLKHMAHHLLDLDTGFLSNTTNAFLIRNPREMLPSLTVQLPNAGLFDTGLQQQWELFEKLRAAGQHPVVLDSRELLLNPGNVLRQFCTATGLDYADRMLRWPEGGRPEDGVWAPFWYHAVHRSTGFVAYRPKNTFPGELQDLLDQCEPWYQRLYDHALRAETNDPQWSNDEPA